MSLDIPPTPQEAAVMQITVSTALPATTLTKYLKGLDELALPYDFIVVDSKPKATILELRVNGNDFNSTEIHLHVDGSWALFTNIPLGEPF